MDAGMVLFTSLPPELYEEAWPAVVGFSFTCKSWGDVLVEGLSAIRFDESAFQRLVLEKSRKR